MRLVKNVCSGNRLISQEFQNEIISGPKAIVIQEIGQDNVYQFACTIPEMVELVRFIKERSLEAAPFRVEYKYE